ncbi:hypothetical protein [Lentzea sp. NPDC004782]|uniref:hypothetical protein n=1 Tax=Lentzea sp. NPDC004782 TaxID=3154458 RepID=UPI0033BB5AB2
MTVPQRIAWRVMILNRISIWFIRNDPIGVKWKVIRRLPAAGALLFVEGPGFC